MLGCVCDLVFASSFLFQDFGDDIPQFWRFFPGDFPNDLIVDTKVVVDELVSHFGHG